MRCDRVIAVKSTYELAPWSGALVSHDASWWEANPAALEFAGLKVTGQAVEGLEVFPVRAERAGTVEIVSSGIMAVRVAVAAGASLIELIGFDGGTGHWKPGLGARPPVVADAAARALWALADQLRAEGVDVVFPAGAEPPVLLLGAGGLGDNVHRRAVVRGLARRYRVWTETRYPEVYADMKELQRGPPPPGALVKYAVYSPGGIAERGSIVGAMAAPCHVEPGRLAMEVPDAWHVMHAIHTDLPIMVFRPLTRRLSRPLPARQPDRKAYAELFARAREGFFVVSVALLSDDEVLDGPMPAVDLELHSGELSVEGLIGLFAQASLVFSPPCFAAPLAQAVGTPAVTVFGGFEDSRSFAWGAGETRWLPIEPLRRCACWRPDHDCNKRIDMDSARVRLDLFLSSLGVERKERAAA